jgi:NADH dehydrogenase
MRVFVTGGTGFIGSYIIDELIAKGYEIFALVRRESKDKIISHKNISCIYGDIFHKHVLEKGVSQVEAVIHLIGIIRENPGKGITFSDLHYKATTFIVDAAKTRGLRFILMSANGVQFQKTAYQRTKFKAEEYVQLSGLPWTIFRPSVIFGDPRGRMEFATNLVHQIIKPRLPVPLFFSGWNPLEAGLFRLQPIHATDVAKAFVEALENTSTVGEIIQLGGPEMITWRKILEILSAKMDRRKLEIPVPVGTVKLIATLFDRFSWFPVTREQLKMLMQENICSLDKFHQFFDFTLKYFQDNLNYLSCKKSKSVFYFTNKL